MAPRRKQIAGQGSLLGFLGLEGAPIKSKEKRKLRRVSQTNSTKSTKKLVTISPSPSSQINPTVAVKAEVKESNPVDNFFDKLSSQDEFKPSAKTAAASVDFFNSTDVFGGTGFSEKAASPEAETKATSAVAEEPVDTSKMNFAQRRAYRASLSKSDAIEVPKGSPNCLEGLTFVVTGVFSGLEREEAVNTIRMLGGRVTGGVSGRTSYLVKGADPGAAKVTKARKIGTAIITEAQLYDLIRTKSTKLSEEEPASKVSQAPTSTPSDVLVDLPSPQKKRKIAKPLPFSPSQDAAEPGADSLWVDKYAPKTISELVGNKAQIDRIRMWLENWDKVHLKGVDPRTINQREAHIIGTKAILVFGPPGIGKTTALHIIGESLGFHVTEMNASDTRAASDIDSIVRTSSSSTSIGFNGEVYKKFLVMDEVDGMGAGDRGGAAALGRVIDESTIPIALVTNDKQKHKDQFTKRTAEITFRRPTEAQLRGRINMICRREGIRLDTNVLYSLVETSRGDIRQIINTLQIQRSINTRMTFADAKRSVVEKDTMKNPFEAAAALFAPSNRGGNLRERLDLHFTDSSILPLFVNENYLGAATNVAAAAEASYLMSLGDVMDRQIIYGGVMGLSRPRGLLGSVLPPIALRAQGLRSRMNFPQHLGKGSSQRARDRDTSACVKRMRCKVPSMTMSSFVYGGGILLRELILRDLAEAARVPAKQKDAAISRVVKSASVYNISGEEWNFILKKVVELREAARPKETDPRVMPATKSKFTRLLNLAVPPDMSEAFSKKTSRKRTLKKS